MEIFHTISSLRERLEGEREIAFVPTMGNLHQGHLELMRVAGKSSRCVVASIFVNRLQFGAGEDFERYPRTLAEDGELLEKAGVDILFAPDESELYPVPQDVTVRLPEIARDLCGKHRPGHFEGMATVVLKLFNIVRPSCAVFGKKDYQQLHLVTKMVFGFDIPVAILAGETVREPDGLAMSSRNRYLTEIQRGEAARLYFNLERARLEVTRGNSDFASIEFEARSDLEKRGWLVDYFEIRDAATLDKPGRQNAKLVALAAARLGSTRLIDNLEI